MTLYDAIILQQVLAQSGDQRLPGKVAVRLAKLDKEISTERNVLIEVLQKNWQEDFGFDPDNPGNVDEETTEKMNTEFTDEAKNISVDLKNMMTEEDLEAFPTLTVAQAQYISNLIGE